MSLETDIREFHTAFGVEVPSELVRQPSNASIDLRKKLITEEYNEVLESFSHLQYHKAYEIEHLAKELVDLVVVTIGTAVEFGIPFDAVWAEVHKSNMAKLGPDGKPILREDGKILKPNGWKEPDMESVLVR